MFSSFFVAESIVPGEMLYQSLTQVDGGRALRGILVTPIKSWSDENDSTKQGRQASSYILANTIPVPDRYGKVTISFVELAE